MLFRPLAAAVIMLVALPSQAALVIDPVRPPAKPQVPVATTSSDSGRVLYISPDTNVSPASVRGPQAPANSGPVSYSDVNRIIETGGPRPAGSQDPLKGWADSVPLDLALTQVVPSGWSIYADNVDGSKLLSWSGDRPWTQVLGDLAYRGGFGANVQWDKRRVVLYRPGQPAPSDAGLVSARVIRGKAIDSAPASSVVASQVQAPVAAVVVQPRPAPVVSTQKWLIDPRLSLKQNVEAWTRQAGWKAVVWEAADYEMVAPAVFEGDFASQDGPLAKLIRAYSKSDQPLQVELSTMDMVVHVTNKNYQPTVVNPMIPSSISPSSLKN